VKPNLNEFIAWQEENNNRTVTINIRPNIIDTSKSEITIWVYQNGCNMGQYVNSVSEIDLEKTQKTHEINQLLELQKKYLPNRDILNLGYANGWGKNTQEIVVHCEEEGHKCYSINVGKCLTKCGCEICNYTYLVDSSD
jgi:hypothetical protein